MSEPYLGDEWVLRFFQDTPLCVTVHAAFLNDLHGVNPPVRSLANHDDFPVVPLAKYLEHLEILRTGA